MKYLKKFENIKKPDVDEKTIRVEPKNKNWYIDWYFDSDKKLCYVENKWDINIPDWYGFYVTVIDIRSWAKNYSRDAEIYFLLKNDSDKYNL